MAKVLVTGGSGFIGSALCNRMADDGYEVAVFDNASRHGGAASGDIRDAFAVKSAAEGVDAIWHLAAINGCKNFYERPWEVAEVQIRGTLNVIDACVAHGIKKLVLFSTSEAYQSPPIIPTPENVPLVVPDVTNPRYSYGGSKIASEVLCQHAPVESCLTIRPHNVFGPAMGFDHVIPQFIMRAARTPDGGQFDINGMATRSFIYIDDFVDAMMAIWKNVSAREGKVREIFHVGTEEQVSTSALAGMVSEIMGRKHGDRYAYKFKSQPGAVGGTRARCPNIGKLRGLGWEPKIGLREGLERTVKAYLEKKAEWPE